ncbi:hypothetical protein [uncultured Gammaproteobacteria bacterium]|nr:hypothetical protein [uncultured Gammaproteobacteria bacterium]
MNTNKNPFTYEAANNLSLEEIKNLYIDVEKSKFLTSQKNIFIEGHRGSGKSMLLKYNSIDMKYQQNKSLEFIGVYVSCQTPLFFKREYELLSEEFQANITAEHMLVLVMTESLICSIEKNNILDSSNESKFIKEINFYLDLDENISNIEHFKGLIKKEINDIQRNSLKSPEIFYTKSHTYSSLILPIIDSLKSTEKLKDSHFSFFIDDAQNLSEHQRKVLHSWVSFRDTTDTSFKIAITSQREYLFHTGSNDIILEDHDYMMISLEKEFFGNETGFYIFAQQVIEKRLSRCGISKDVKEFFPQHSKFIKDIDEISRKFINGDCEEQKNKTKEQRRASVSKYKRAIWFRKKLSEHKANLPSIAYTGFNTLANISTGVIRNLLIPVSKMYDKEHKGNKIHSIEPKIQYEILKEESKSKWEYIDNLSNRITGCDKETAKRIHNFLKSFGVIIRGRLLDTASSEKRILTFTIEKLDNSEQKEEIYQVLDMAQKSGLLYSRIGSGKDTNRTIWYTPNRILWVDLGLDTEGQNGKINITPDNFYAMMKKEIKQQSSNQGVLFHEE